MAALVQSYPQQSSTVTMLQTRPSSASGILQDSSQSQSHHPYPANPSQMQRNSFHGMNNVMGVSNYRGHTAVAPIAPYAFTSTPGLTMPGQRTQGHLRSDQRTSSAPNVQTFHHSEPGNNVNRSRYPAAPSVSTTSSSSSDLSALSHKSGTRDDSAIASKSRVTSGATRPQSTIISPGQTLAPPALSSPVKPSPDRYRRPNNRRAESSSSQQSAAQISQASALPNVMQFYSNSAQQPFNVPMAPSSKNTSGYTSALGVTTDDMQLHRHSTPDQAKRYRRRSIHTIDARDYTYNVSNPISGGFPQQASRQVSSANGRIDHQQQPLRSSPVVTIRPALSHGRNGSSESVDSTRSSHSRPNSVSIPLNSYTAFSHFINLSLSN